MMAVFAVVAIASFTIFFAIILYGLFIGDRITAFTAWVLFGLFVLAGAACYLLGVL